MSKIELKKHYSHHTGFKLGPGIHDTATIGNRWAAYLVSHGHASVVADPEELERETKRITAEPDASFDMYRATKDELIVYLESLGYDLDDVPATGSTGAVLKTDVIDFINKKTKPVDND